MPRILVASGPRAVEKALFEVLEHLTPRESDDLAHPVRIIVPSLSLRLHLNRLLVAKGFTAGFLVQTLHSLALEVLSRMGVEKTTGSSTYEILVRRLARSEPSLRAGLEHLEDGYATVLATIRDLLDAGFDVEHEEPLLEQLEAIGPLAPPVRARAQSLIRVAVGTIEGAELLGIGRGSTLMRSASESIINHPERALPRRSLVIHGFSDATGVAGDLLETLLRHRDACIIIDRPEPETGAGNEFSALLLERFSGVEAAEIKNDTTLEPPSIAATKSNTRSSEVRHVFDSIRTYLKNGMSPESIGIVARNFAPYATLIRRHAERLGIPISSVGEQVNGGATRRRAHCFATVLEKGPLTPVETWLESMPENSSNDLLLWMRSAGISLVSDLATITEIPEYDATLPIIAGWTDKGRTRRRRLSKISLQSSIERAQELIQVIDQWSELAPACVHFRTTLEMISANTKDSSDTIFNALNRLANDICPTLPITREEWSLLARHTLESLGNVPLAGQGGGVRILNVMEARGLTFDTLFVIGLNRDHFPRIVREDPLMPDAVRSRLTTILPDIPIKERGWAEEQHLFAQLLSAAVDIELSWSLNEGNAPLSASPFAERLGLEAKTAHELWQTHFSRIRPAFEHAILSGLGEDRPAHISVLKLAIEEAGRRFPSIRGIDSERVAEARVQALEEIDPSTPRSDLGPFCGLVGVARTGDPRTNPLSVTRIEGICSCPLQAMLTRVLGVENMRDHRLQLPDADARLVGMVIHGVLQEIVMQAISAATATGRSGDDPISVPWPVLELFDRIVAATALSVARKAGVERSGLAPILDRRSRSGLENARLADWGDPSNPPQCIGAEVSGCSDITDPPVDFRADRKDKVGESLLFTDYKNTRGVTTLRGLNNRIKSGSLLQAAAYALSDADASGRYLYLKDTKKKTGPVDLRITGNEPGIRENFTNAVRTAVEAWEIGALLPRIADREKDGDNSSCQYCQVKQACLRGDSGFRARLLRWRDLPPGASELERRAHSIWWLGADPEIIPSARSVEVDNGE